MIDWQLRIRAATEQDVRRAVLHLGGAVVAWIATGRFPRFLRDQSGHAYAVQVRDKTLEGELEASVKMNEKRKLRLVK